MRHFWVVVGLLGCGSVNSAPPDAPAPDAPGSPDAPPDAPAASPGALRWVRSLSSLEALGVSDGAGGLVVVGAISAPAQLGGATLTPTGGTAMVIAGFDADDASHLFSVSHGATGNVFPFLHDVTANGAPIVYGVSSGAVDLGQGVVAGAGTSTDGYIGVYGPGAPQWVARIVGAGEDKIVASALGSGSTFYGGGWFEQTTTVSVNGTDVATKTSAGGRDIFLARFNVFTAGVDLVRTYGSAGLEEISGAAATSGGVVVTGHFDETSNLASPGTLALGGTAAALTSHGGHDVWVAKLDTNGDGVWAVGFGGAGEDRDPRVAVDAAGDVYVAGSFTGEVAFGAINLVSRGGPDVFLTKLHGGDGTVAWAISFGATTPTSTMLNDAVGGLAVDAAGHVTVSARIAGPLDGGSSAGSLDACIASFDTTTGAPRWRTVISTPGDDSSSALAYGRNGDLYAIVGLGGAFDFGMPIIGAAGASAVLLRIAP
jgi:hypothetical protein